MNDKLVKQAQAIMEDHAKRYGLEVSININESPLKPRNKALYLDGEIVDRYWNNDGYGWEFQDELVEAFKEAGLFVEPYSSTIFDVYKA